MMDTDTPYVLAVDDEDGLRVFYRRILENVGYRIETAGDAEEALTLARRHTPAVAIVDIHMPGRGGLWLCEQIREMSRDTALILATSDDTVPPTASLKRGVTRYLIKPFRPAMLLTAVADGFRWWATEGHHEVPPAVSSAIAAADVRAKAAEPSAAERGRSRAARRRPWKRPAWIATAALAAVAAVASWWVFARNSRGTVVDRLSVATAAVQVFGPSGAQTMQGSGFFVGPDLFFTAQHVVRGASRIHLQGADRTYSVAGVLAIDRARDVALLKTVSTSPAYLSLSEREPAVGDTILVYGAPLGLSGTLSTGIVSRIDPSAPPRIQFTAPISPGASGSPVTDASSAVIGMAVSSRTGGQALNFAVPVTVLRALRHTKGAVLPLIALARGAFDDREREELVGPVRTARLETTDSARPTSRRAVTLFFDRLGRLTQQEDVTTGSSTYTTYDSEGHLLSEVTRQNGDVIAQYDFVNTGSHRYQARDGASGLVRVLDYDSDGHLVSDEVRRGPTAIRRRTFQYNTRGWPGADAPPRSDDVDFDAVGNIIRLRDASGTETRFTYVTDAHGNWSYRATYRGDELLRTERRVIEYWD